MNKLYTKYFLASLSLSGFVILSGVEESFGQNISINTTGAANSTNSILEVLGNSTAVNGMGLYVSQSAAVTNAIYGFQLYNISTSSTGSINKYGLDIQSTGVWNGASSNNIGLQLTATGGTNNYALIVPASSGIVGIGTTAPTSTALVTINPTTNAVRTGIDMTLSGAASTAYGINIAANNQLVNGVSVTNSASGITNAFSAVGGVLSSTNIVSGYNGYRNGSGISYGLYGINGTTATYATNANTWAAFLQGRTVISSESSPSSLLGTDLEIRNTTTGAGNPATVSMRQTISNTTNGTVLTNLNFGDNNQTGGQAQIQVIRGAASSSSADLPTDMLFYTTPDASSTLTERMRIKENGNVGIGNASPDASALVDMASTTKGLLPPRMTEAQRTAIGSPATGLLIYQSDSDPGYYWYNGTIWTKLSIDLYSNTTVAFSSAAITTTTSFAIVTGVTQTITLDRNAKVIVMVDGGVGVSNTTPGNYTMVDVAIHRGGALLASGGFKRMLVTNHAGGIGAATLAPVSLNSCETLVAGTYTYDVRSKHNTAGLGGSPVAATVGGTSASTIAFTMIVQIIYE